MLTAKFSSLTTVPEATTLNPCNPDSSHLVYSLIINCEVLGSLGTLNHVEPPYNPSP